MSRRRRMTWSAENAATDWTEKAYAAGETDVGVRVDDVWHADAAVHDAIASVVFCASPHVDFSIIDGRQRVRDGEPVGIDVPLLVERHNRIAWEMISHA